MRLHFTILSLWIRLFIVARNLSFIISLFIAQGAFAQSTGLVSYLSGFTSTDQVSKEILASKSVVLHGASLTDTDLKTIQLYFQQTGIDAVAYFDADILVAGKDVESAYFNYFIKRGITYLIFVEHSDEYKINFVSIGEKKLLDNKMPVWVMRDLDLSELLKNIYRTALYDQPRKNYLVNDLPESDISVNIFTGRRSEYYAIDLKVDQLAVQKSGDEEYDQQLEEIFTSHYPYKFTMVEPELDEKEIRKKGIPYILCQIHTRGEAAKELLNYSISTSQSAISSVTFPNGELRLKTIPKETVISKFYVRHIDSGNTFLGTKWDADILWQDALRNHIKNFKAELNIN